MQDEYEQTARKLRKLKARLRQGAVKKYPPSEKSLELVNQIVREQFQEDQQRLLAEEKSRKLRILKIGQAMLYLQRIKKAELKAKAKEEKEAKKAKPEWEAKTPED